MNGLAETAELLRSTADDLASDNDLAEREKDKRDWQQLDRMLRKHGICNVIGIAADLVGEIADEHAEGSLASEDYRLAQRVLDAAAQAVDLTYGTSPVRFRQCRLRATEAVIALAREIEP